ncbi:hypothetical protein BY996DRAFT_6419340 [Phakopsora pachyrhizi]|nr:hypothetical protein BY996DRAFT_6419340 [Phakopsora pachyrhizi]
MRVTIALCPETPGEKTEAKAPKKKGKEVGLKLIERIKCKQTGKDEDKVIYLMRLASKVNNSQIASLLVTSVFQPLPLNSMVFILLYLRQLRTFSPISIEGKVGDLTKERDKASAKGQKSGGRKNNEMVRIIKEQALKFE